MATAQKDDNGYPCWTGISCVDGVTPIRIKMDSATGGMILDTTTVISVVPSTNFPKTDANDQPILKGVSSSDSSVVLPVYVNPDTGGVLADVL